MEKCSHQKREEKLVTFKNGTNHIQILCQNCKKKIGFAPKRGRNLQTLSKGNTTRQDRLKAGLPVGCLGCFDNEVRRRVTGFCASCELRSLHKLVDRYCKRVFKDKWKLTQGELLEIYAGALR